MYNPETKQWEGYIYCATNIEDGMEYIGQTRINVDWRWNQHIVASRCKNDNSVFHTMIRLYGEEMFSVRPIKTICSDNYGVFKRLLNQAEREAIRNHNCIYPNGYNISHGCGGTGEHLKNENKPCELYDYDGVHLESFNSIKDAAGATGLSGATIGDCCRGKHYRTSVGVFRFRGDSFDKYKIINNNRLRGEHPVDKYLVNGTYVRSYDKIKDAAIDNGITLGKAQYYVEYCSLVDSSYVLIAHGDKFDINNVRRLGNIIDEVDVNGNVIATYKNYTEASSITGVSSTSIWECCSGKYTHVKGRRFILRDEEIINSEKNKVSNKADTHPLF